MVWLAHRHEHCLVAAVPGHQLSDVLCPLVIDQSAMLLASKYIMAGTASLVSCCVSESVV